MRRKLLVALGVMVVAAGSASSTTTRGLPPECGYFDDWKDNQPLWPDDFYHAGTGGGLAAIEAAFGPANGVYQQVGSMAGNNYHDWAEAGTISGSHATCGDTTYYPTIPQG